MTVMSQGRQTAREKFNLQEYQKWTKTTENGRVASWDWERQLAYFGLGIAGESGEVAEKIKKLFRDCEDPDGSLDSGYREIIGKELGDVLWYVTRIASVVGLDLQDLFEANVSKIEDRKARGTIEGNGDHR